MKLSDLLDSTIVYHDENNDMVVVYSKSLGMLGAIENTDLVEAGVQSVRGIASLADAKRAAEEWMSEGSDEGMMAAESKEFKLNESFFDKKKNEAAWKSYENALAHDNAGKFEEASLLYSRVAKFAEEAGNPSLARRALKRKAALDRITSEGPSKTFESKKSQKPLKETFVQYAGTERKELKNLTGKLVGVSKTGIAKVQWFKKDGKLFTESFESISTLRKINESDEDDAAVAKQHGKDAFHRGDMRVPGQDKELNAMMKNGSDHKTIMKAWLSGWDEENLAAT